MINNIMGGFLIGSTALVAFVCIDLDKLRVGSCVMRTRACVSRL